MKAPTTKQGTRSAVAGQPSKNFQKKILKTLLTATKKCGIMNTQSRESIPLKYKMKEVDTMTYVDALNVAIATLSDADAVEKLTALRDQYVKRASAERKPTAKQTENAGIKTQILDDIHNPEKAGCDTGDRIGQVWQNLCLEKLLQTLS